MVSSLGQVCSEGESSTKVAGKGQLRPGSGDCPSGGCGFPGCSCGVTCTNIAWWRGRSAMSLCGPNGPEDMDTLTLHPGI